MIMKIFNVLPGYFEGLPVVLRDQGVACHSEPYVRKYLRVFTRRLGIIPYMNAGNNCVVYLKGANNVTFTPQPQFWRRPIDLRDQLKVIVSRKQHWKVWITLKVYAAGRMN